jgi:hypothetical protein
MKAEIETRRFIMWFWNRKEIYFGTSLKEFSDLRDIVALSGIRYDYKIMDHSSSTRGRFGNLGLNPNYEKQYYLYVHKKDYENAKYIINNRSRSS